jgi:hypothetical protein
MLSWASVAHSCNLSVILATWEDKIWRIIVQGKLGKTPFPK